MTNHRSSAIAPDAVVADDAAGLTTALKTEARRLGFDLVGIAPAVTPTGIHEFLDWLDRGYAGQMAYLERREEAYQHPRHVLDGVRSVVMLGLNYNTQEPAQHGNGQHGNGQHGNGRHGDGRRGETSTVSPAVDQDASRPAIPARIARYALGQRDYHDVIREKLHALAGFLRRASPGAKARGVVDTAPLLERDFARLAGLGWFGKNTMLINKHLGSWFFLAALLVDLELEYDTPHAASHCGTCTRCLDACPTDAFVEPYVLDARRCISYLTIEHRGPIPAEFHAPVGDWLFGCDICQEVCPWNRKAPVSSAPEFQPQPALQSVVAAALLNLTDEEFHRQFGATALARPGRAGLVRNAAVVAGNSGAVAGVESPVG